MTTKVKKQRIKKNKSDLTFLDNGTKEIFYRYEIELSKQAKNSLLKVGRSEIINDEEVILNYIINRILKNQIKKDKRNV